jgi:hypothetical protein
MDSRAAARLAALRRAPPRPRARVRALRRPSRGHAGAAYAKEPEKLRSDLDGWLAGGATGGREQGRLRALIAPHIDFHRGGAGYGKTYAALCRRERPDVVVVLGTGHAADEGRFILCDKSFATPLGDLPADREFIGRLERRLPRSHRRGQLAHRGEHSIEFQALWLAHLFPGEPRPGSSRSSARSFDDLMRGERRPQASPTSATSSPRCATTWLEERRTVLVVAGADSEPRRAALRRPEPPQPAFLDEVRGRDLAAVGGGAAAAPADRFSSAPSRRTNSRPHLQRRPASSPRSTRSAPERRPARLRPGRRSERQPRRHLRRASRSTAGRGPGPRDASTGQTRC